MEKIRITDVKSLPEARGKRLKSLRMLAGLSRKMVEEKYEISASTIQSWEDGKAGGLTEKGARRILNALREEGIQCSLNWLLYGIGVGPHVSDKIYIPIAEASEEQDLENYSYPDRESALVKELLVFRQSNADAIDMVVMDDSMEPFYSLGDYIGGKRRYAQEIAGAIGLDCIVETTMGEIMFRRLRRGSTSQCFTLTCINPNTLIEKITLYDVELHSAAPVIWHRCRDI